MKKFSLKNINLPTPSRIKKIGDSMVAAGVFVGAATFISDFPKVALASVLIGGLGKFLSTCFAPDEDENKNKNDNEKLL